MLTPPAAERELRYSCRLLPITPRAADAAFARLAAFYAMLSPCRDATAPLRFRQIRSAYAILRAILRRHYAAFHIEAISSCRLLRDASGQLPIKIIYAMPLPLRQMLYATQRCHA